MRHLMCVNTNNKYAPSRALPLLKDQDGSPVASPSQAKLLQLNHFAGTELASIDSWEVLCEKYSTTAKAVPVHPPNLDNIMDPLHYQFMLAASKRGRAPDRNNITTELVKVAHTQFHRLYYPIRVKAALFSNS